MKDYVTFKSDGITCKEEILFWRQTDSNPLTIRFLTPNGLYKYEQTEFSDEEIHGVSRPPKVILNKFYKLNGTDEECYFSFSRVEKEIFAKWQPIHNLESFTINLPN
jgi:hypothetical protein